MFNDEPQRIITSAAAVLSSAELFSLFDLTVLINLASSGSRQLFSVKKFW